MLCLIQRMVGAFEDRRDAGHAWACAGDSDTDGNGKRLRTDDRATFPYLVQQSLRGDKAAASFASGSNKANSSPPILATTSDSRLVERQTTVGMSFRLSSRLISASASRPSFFGMFKSSRIMGDGARRRAHLCAGETPLLPRRLQRRAIGGADWHREATPCARPAEQNGQFRCGS
jgi:hypothetical protein